MLKHCNSSSGILFQESAIHTPLKTLNLRAATHRPRRTTADNYLLTCTVILFFPTIKPSSNSASYDQCFLIFIKHQEWCFISVLWEYTNPKVYKERIPNACLLLFQFVFQVCVTVFTDIMFITAFLLFLYELFKMFAAVWIVPGMRISLAAVEWPISGGLSLCTGVKCIGMLLACLFVRKRSLFNVPYERALLFLGEATWTNQPCETLPLPKAGVQGHTCPNSTHPP